MRYLTPSHFRLGRTLPLAAALLAILGCSGTSAPSSTGVDTRRMRVLAEYHVAAMLRAVVWAECSRQEMLLDVLYERMDGEGQYFSRFPLDPDRLASLESQGKVWLMPIGPGNGGGVEGPCKVVERTTREPIMVEKAILDRFQAFTKAGAARKESVVIVTGVNSAGGIEQFEHAVSPEALKRLETVSQFILLYQVPGSTALEGRVKGECPFAMQEDRAALQRFLFPK